MFDFADAIERIEQSKKEEKENKKILVRELETLIPQLKDTLLVKRIAHFLERYNWRS